MINYTPESSLLHPKRLFRQMFLDLWSSHELALRIFLRDFNAQYRQTFLGFFWAFLPPLLMTTVFIFLNKTQVMTGAPPDVPSPLFILTGMVYWQLFVDCLLNPAKVVDASKNLIAKITFPVEGLILAAIYQGLASFFVRLILLLGFCLWFSYYPGLLVLPVMLLSVFPIVVFGICLGLLLIPLELLYKDFAEAVSLSTTFLLFITPVGYYINVNASAGRLAWYFKWNPLVYLINFPRDTFFGILPGYSAVIFGIFGAGLLVLFLGWVLFKLSLPIIFERLSA